MRTIMATRFGAPEVLELVELPTPDPGRGELRVNVEAVGVGWLDTMIRQGKGPDAFPVEPPYVPGGAVAGTIDAVGAGVDGQWLGVRVLTQPAGGGYGGGYTDTLIVRPETVVRVPGGLDLHSALALKDDGSTALALLEKTPVHAGERVLVAPGLGGLGSILVQLASAAGATVVAAVRGAEKLAAAKALGVSAVDYAGEDWPAQVRGITGGHDLDVVFDGVGGELGTASVALLADGGRFSSYGVSSGAAAVVGDQDRQRLTVTDMGQLTGFWAESTRRVEHVLREAAAGRLRTIVGRTYPLADAAASHEDIEGRRYVGKLLLIP